MDFRVVIPARFGSSRLPGKPLLPIAGKPMIEHVWQRAQESGAREIVVATDDERILRAVEAFGGRAVMTLPTHASGTDRLAEVAQTLGWPEQTIVVNLQGDEPLLPGRWLARIASLLDRETRAGIATLATPVTNPVDIGNPNVVKVVLDQESFALYFSRAPIPWVRDSYAAPGGFSLGHDVPVLRHLGLYAYRVGALTRVASSPLAALERAEALEQLRALHLGIRICVEVTTESLGHGVDTASDLEAVAAILRAR
ncbi:MAG: 3-deoxy-manno-octulosonate cytidylyltransferase [Myxococcales bacterium]